MPSLNVICDFFREAGLTVGPTFSLSEKIFSAEQYLNKEGPLQKAWRNTDRCGCNLFFSLCRPFFSVFLFVVKLFHTVH